MRYAQPLTFISHALPPLTAGTLCIDSIVARFPAQRGKLNSQYTRADCGHAGGYSRRCPRGRLHAHRRGTPQLRLQLHHRPSQGYEARHAPNEQSFDEWRSRFSCVTQMLDAQRAEEALWSGQQPNSERLSVLFYFFNDAGGSTACAVFIRSAPGEWAGPPPLQLVCANSGDSRAILCALPVRARISGPLVMHVPLVLHLSSYMKWVLILNPSNASANRLAPPPHPIRSRLTQTPAGACPARRPRRARTPQMKPPSTALGMTRSGAR